MSNDNSLYRKLKNAKKIDTDLGEFIFSNEQLGEGGNSLVFLFEKNDTSSKFAIKFLKRPNKNSQKEVCRFKDEFFCSQQISSHKNLAKYYHFDKINLDGEEYFLIIMKHYDSTLKKIRDENLSKADFIQLGKKLVDNLLAATKHLHAHEIIHRDIKPENIFFDSITRNFVLGDLGIARFPEELPKLSHTDRSDRLANWSFSPKEQVDSARSPEKNWDYFAIAQIIQWYFTGSTTRGENRKKIVELNGSDYEWVDNFTGYCLQDEPANRPQSFEDIDRFIKEYKTKSQPLRTPWDAIYALDEIIRKNFTKIHKVEETQDKRKIRNFLSDFNEIVPLEFWMMGMDGGDWSCNPISPISDDLWLTEGYEIDIDKLIIYRDECSIHKNFFLIITNPGQPFSLRDNQGNITFSENKEQDYARLWLDKSIYLSIDDTINGYFEMADGKTLKLDYDNFPERCRHLNRMVYMVAPLGTPLNLADREPSKQLMKSVLNLDTLRSEDVDEYEDRTRGKFSPEIKNWL